MTASKSFETFFDRLQAMKRGDEPLPPIASLVGFQIADVTPGSVTLELETSERHFNAVGTVHGGVFCDLADAAMGLSFGTSVAAGESFTTVELKINYLRPVWRTRLRAVGRILNAGRNLGLTEAAVSDGDGKLVAHATSTLMVLRGTAARGR